MNHRRDFWRLAASSLLWMAAACASPKSIAAPGPTGNAPVPPARASSPPSAEVDRKGACLVAARACGKYAIENNYEGVVDCMPDEAMEVLGGRSAIVEIMRKGNAEMAGEGARLEKSLIDPPSEMTKAASRTFAILPQVTVIRVPQGHLHQQSFLVGISSDDGQSWKFVDGVRLNRKLLEKLFPDFPSSITLPTVSRPELVN